VVRVEGEFEAAEVVSIVDGAGLEFARGFRIILAAMRRA